MFERPARRRAVIGAALAAALLLTGCETIGNIGRTVTLPAGALEEP